MSRCALPFFPNKSNYVSDDEHDGNPRKLWYLVLGEGLFTKKTDADVLSNEDDIHIYFTKARARRHWDDHCCRQHVHEEDDDDRPRHATRSSTTVNPTPSAPPVTKAKTPSGRAPTKPKARAGASAPIKREGGATVKREPSVRVKLERGPSASIKLEPQPRQLPLYLDGSDDDDDALECDDVVLPLHRDDSPIRDNASGGKRSVPPQAGSKRARGGTTSSASYPAPRTLSPVPLSPSVSSASSLSSATLSGATAASSVSAQIPRRPVPRAAAAQLAAAASNASVSGSTRLLYNSAQRILYKDVEKAVREMGPHESMQVVECADVADFCAGGTGKMSGRSGKVSGKVSREMSGYCAASFGICMYTSCSMYYASGAPGAPNELRAAGIELKNTR
ncbi:hypothetical protein DFH09DRAFT_1073390 [Mycena vulgaris]|nr:hypothetical protein DFH09DRAFT_1073390 [Mycena vulgaris]